MGLPKGPSRSVGVPRWVGSPLEQIHGRLVRRGEDEHRHRHPIRVHPSIAAHMFTNYDGVLKVDGEVGNKRSTTRAAMKEGRVDVPVWWSRRAPPSAGRKL